MQEGTVVPNVQDCIATPEEIESREYLERMQQPEHIKLVVRITMMEWNLLPQEELPTFTYKSS